MFVVLMLGWWYGRGWGWIAAQILSKVDAIFELFSVGILLKTWFSPWKQIQSPSSFQNFLQASVDNFISRFIGATVRTFMLIAAAVSITAVMVGGMIVFVLWAFVPVSIFVIPLVSLIKVGA